VQCDFQLACARQHVFLSLCASIIINMLTQAYNAIALGMKRASSGSGGRGSGAMENGDVVAPPRPQALRSSKRDRGQPEHYDPSQDGRSVQLAASQQRPAVRAMQFYLPCAAVLSSGMCS
jgi:hypothetical protein